MNSRHSQGSHRSRAPVFNKAQREPMSAARLAAEAAFSAPPSPATATDAPAQVTLRKSRWVLGTDELAAGNTNGDAAGNAAGAASAGKSARVFRVNAEPVAVVNRVHETASAVPRTRRLDADKRPGPVVHLVQALPAREAVALMPAPSPQAMRAELHQVGLLLQAAERASALRFDVDSPAQEWQRLSQKIDSLQRDLEQVLEQDLHQYLHRRLHQLPQARPR
jgi:hypothetical protein